MCFKYEDRYGKCWDHLFFDTDGSILEALGSVGAEVADKEAFRREVFNVFEQLHTDGVIRPKGDSECPGIEYLVT